MCAWRADGAGRVSLHLSEVATIHEEGEPSRRSGGGETARGNLWVAIVADAWRRRVHPKLHLDCGASHAGGACVHLAASAVPNHADDRADPCDRDDTGFDGRHIAPRRGHREVDPRRDELEDSDPSFPIGPLRGLPCDVRAPDAPRRHACHLRCVRVQEADHSLWLGIRSERVCADCSCDHPDDVEFCMLTHARQGDVTKWPAGERGGEVSVDRR